MTGARRPSFKPLPPNRKPRGRDPMDFKAFRERLKSFRKKLKWLDPFTYVDLFVMPRVNPGNDKLVSWAVYVFFAFLFAFTLYNGLGLLLGTPSPMVIVVSGSMEPVFFRGDVIVLVGAGPEQVRAQELVLDLPLQGVPARSYLQSRCSGNAFDSASLVPCESFLALLAQRRAKDTDFSVKELRFSDGQALELNREGDVIVYFSQALQEPIIHRVIAKLRARDGVYFLTKGDSAHNPLIDQETHITQYAVPASEVQGKMVLRVPFLGWVKLLVFDVPKNLVSGCYVNGRCPFP